MKDNRHSVRLAVLTDTVDICTSLRSRWLSKSTPVSPEGAVSVVISVNQCAVSCPANISQFSTLLKYGPALGPIRLPFQSVPEEGRLEGREANHPIYCHGKPFDA